MSKFLDELENYSKGIRETKEKIISLRKKYRQVFDVTIKDEMAEEENGLKRLEKKTVELLYKNISELKLLRQYYPELFKEIRKENEKYFEKVGWVLDFKEMNEQKANEELEKIRKEREKLKKNDMEKNKELKRKGWLIILNEFLMAKYLKKYLGLYFENLNEEKKLEQEYLNGEGHLSSSEESKIGEKINGKKRKRIKFRKICKRMLYSNPKLLKKLKSIKRMGSKFSDREHNFIDRLEVNVPDEFEWVRSMEKLEKN